MTKEYGYMPNNLVAYLERCDDAYYNSSNPIVSDSTYDALVNLAP